MATYDHKQVLADYASGKITSEMAVGHSLQHIDKLYEAQMATQVKTDVLEKRVNLLQATVDRLLAFVEKLRVKPKRNDPGASPKA
ncbi:MAG: hypothetical protein U0350_10090 [Caldilineaceae bacterium]